MLYKYKSHQERQAQRFAWLGFKGRKARISDEAIAIFLRQLATLLSAGIPLLQACRTVQLGQKNKALKIMTEAILSDIQHGFSFSEALKNQSCYFNATMISLIHMGEQSGLLDLLLEKVATDKEKQNRLRSKILKIMLYPLLTLGLSLLISLALLIFVVPQFKALFDSVDMPLPVLTRVIIEVSELIQNQGYILIVGFFVLFLIGKWVYQKYAIVSFSLQSLFLKTPLIGDIIKRLIVIRMSQMLAISLGAGIVLDEALHHFYTVLQNQVFKLALTNIHHSIHLGQSLQSALRSSPLFPEQFVQLVALGEDSGTLPALLEKASQFYQEEFDQWVDQATHLLEPLIMIILGVLVGTLVLAMYLPIFKLGSLF